MLTGDARTLHRAEPYWRVDDGLRADRCPRCRALRLARGCGHSGAARHQAAVRGQTWLSPPLPSARQCETARRPVLDAENGYVLAPMEQGIRITTGVEFAARDARPTPVQLDRLLPAARELFPLGDAGRSEAVARRATVLSRLAAGHWASAAPARIVARLRPRSLGVDARPGNRPPHCRDDDRRDAVLRSEALWRGTLYTVTTDEKGRAIRSLPRRAPASP